jgi:hypothetical protein
MDPEYPEHPIEKFKEWKRPRKNTSQTHRFLTFAIRVFLDLGFTESEAADLWTIFERGLTLPRTCGKVMLQGKCRFESGSGLSYGRVV